MSTAAKEESSHVYVWLSRYRIRTSSLWQRQSHRQTALVCVESQRRPAAFVAAKPLCGLRTRLRAAQQQRVQASQDCGTEPANPHHMLLKPALKHSKANYKDHLVFVQQEASLNNMRHLLPDVSPTSSKLMPEVLARLVNVRGARDVDCSCTRRRPQMCERILLQSGRKL